MNMRTQLWLIGLLSMLLGIIAPVRIAEATIQYYTPVLKFNHVVTSKISKHSKKYQAAICLALNVYYEAPASTEPVESQYGVALVAFNRAHHQYKKVCHEIYRPWQFTWTMHEQIAPHGHDWTEAKKVAWNIVTGVVPDFTEGATYYFADYIEPPAWSVNKLKIAKWGAHIYFKDREPT